MSWTSYHAKYYKGSKIDRKAECDSYFTEGLNKGHYKIEKSIVKGSVYYAAIRDLVKRVGSKEGENIYEPLPESEQNVWAMVMLTSVDMKDWFNFAYKEIHEDMGPAYVDCPDSILNLLSPTESKWALEWREKCGKRNAARKELQKLPLGATIKVRGKETSYELTKCYVGWTSQIRWVDNSKGVYMRPNDIITFGYQRVS